YVAGFCDLDPVEFFTSGLERSDADGRGRAILYTRRMGPPFSTLLQLPESLFQIHQKAPHLSSHLQRHGERVWFHERDLGYCFQDSLSRTRSTSLVRTRKGTRGPAC